MEPGFGTIWSVRPFFLENSSDFVSLTIVFGICFQYTEKSISGRCFFNASTASFICSLYGPWKTTRLTFGLLFNALTAAFICSLYGPWKTTALTFGDH